MFFFNDVYKPQWDKHCAQDRPWVLWNCDETLFQASRASQKVYCRSSTKNAYSLQADVTKTGFTVLFCANAAGQYLDPFIVYRAKGLRLSWTTDGLDNAVYSFSDSGWMMDINFEKWFETFFIPQAHRRAPNVWHILFFDGHASHISYRTCEIAVQNKITLICLPANTSHALQPLDVGVFKSVKTIYSHIVLSWNDKTNGANITKENFPMLMKMLWEFLDPEWIKAGFRKSGLYPFNPEAVYNKILQGPKKVPSLADEGQRSLKSSIVRAVYDVLA